MWTNCSNGGTSAYSFYISPCTWSMTISHSRQIFKNGKVTGASPLLASTSSATRMVAQRAQREESARLAGIEEARRAREAEAAAASAAFSTSPIVKLLPQISLSTAIAFFVNFCFRTTRRRRHLVCRRSPSDPDESEQENLQITSRGQQGAEDYAEEDEKEAGQGVVGWGCWFPCGGVEGCSGGGEESHWHWH